MITQPPNPPISALPARPGGRAIPPAIIYDEMFDIGAQLCSGDLKNALRQFHNLVRDLSARKRSRPVRPA